MPPLVRGSCPVRSGAILPPDGARALRCSGRDSVDAHGATGWRAGSAPDAGAPCPRHRSTSLLESLTGPPAPRAPDEKLSGTRPETRENEKHSENPLESTKASEISLSCCFCRFLLCYQWSSGAALPRNGPFLLFLGYRLLELQCPFLLARTLDDVVVSSPGCEKRHGACKRFRPFDAPPNQLVNTHSIRYHLVTPALVNLGSSSAVERLPALCWRGCAATSGAAVNLGIRRHHGTG